MSQGEASGEATSADTAVSDSRSRPRNKRLLFKSIVSVVYPNLWLFVMAAPFKKYRGMEDT